MDTRRAPRPHRATAAGLGFQRSASRPNASSRGGRGVTADSERVIAAAIGEAEDIRDPLDGLLDSAATDPGAPFVPEVLERLIVLKRENRPGFENLRAQLKKVGCRITAVDEAIAKGEGTLGGRGPTQADILI